MSKTEIAQQALNTAEATFAAARDAYLDACDAQDALTRPLRAAAHDAEFALIAARNDLRDAKIADELAAEAAAVAARSQAETSTPANDTQGTQP